VKPCPYPVERLLPQAHPMILIDEVVGCEPGRLRAAVAVRPGAPFFQDGCGIAAHIAIEWMAQSCAALIGIEMLDAGRKVGLGLLLGTRNFKSTVPWFHVGERFIVTGSLTYRDQQMGVFDCAVTRDPGTEVVATAQLTTYQPDDVTALMVTRGQGPGKAGSGA
jgi:predicted hotdog family 3-hydroxylacyl-ACP dehydratase